jgi:hypothetical protein
VASYNWYPAAVPVALPLLWRAWRTVRETAPVWRAVLEGAVAAIVLGLPVLVTLGMGVEQLTVVGGIPGPDVALFLVAFAASVALAAGPLMRSREPWARPMIVVVVVDALMTGAIVFGVRVANGAYTYYAQKFVYLGGTIAIMSAGAIALALVASRERRPVVFGPRVLDRVTECIAGGLVAFAALQMFGYVGPDGTALAWAPVSLAQAQRTTILDNAPSHTREASTITALPTVPLLADLPLDQQVLVLDPATTVPGLGVLENLWAGSILERLTDRQVDLAQSALSLLAEQPVDPTRLATAIAASVDPTRVVVVTTPAVTDALVSIDPRWSGRTVAIVATDGVVSLSQSR